MCRAAAQCQAANEVRKQGGENRRRQKPRRLHEKLHDFLISQLRAYRGSGFSISVRGVGLTAVAVVVVRLGGRVVELGPLAVLRRCDDQWA